MTEEEKQEILLRVTYGFSDIVGWVWLHQFRNNVFTEQDMKDFNKKVDEVRFKVLTELDNILQLGKNEV